MSTTKRKRVEKKGVKQPFVIFWYEQTCRRRQPESQAAKSLYETKKLKNWSTAASNTEMVDSLCDRGRAVSNYALNSS